MKENEIEPIKVDAANELLDMSSDWINQEMGGTKMEPDEVKKGPFSYPDGSYSNEKLIPMMEIFGPTIQGEGAFVGQPSIFVRTGYCNFRCRGFGCSYVIDGEERFGCDSFYSVDPSYSKEWMNIDAEQCLEKVRALIPKDYAMTPHVIFTGGEPLLHWNNKHYQQVLKTLIEDGHKVTIETNTSVHINFDFEYQKEIVFSMSTKLRLSEEPEWKRLNYININNIIYHAKKSIFKFVVSTETDIEEILDIVKTADPVEVYLMPMGETRVNLAKNLKYVAELCIKHGFAMSPRLHIDIWDDLPGV
jgi:7-carboxy-7-deazaguanine synthase